MSWKKPKKSTIQKAAALATMGMPAPIQRLAMSKLGSFLLIVGGAALLATGVITVSWTNGKPTVTVNKDRAQELERTVEGRAQVVAERIVEERQQDYRY